MGRLTTHVLDTSIGQPASGVRIELFTLDDGRRKSMGSYTTNADGRCDQPLLADQAFSVGVYELQFAIGSYFAQTQTLPEPRFLDQVIIRFGISDADQHYHVPLLISPFGYSTYRGS